MSEERIVEVDNLSIESRRIYENIVDVIKGDDRLCLDLAESRRGYVVGGGWEIQCSFLKTPIYVSGDNNAFPVALGFSADSQEDISHGDYVKEKMVEIIGTEPNRRFFKRNQFEGENIDMGNLKDVEMLRIYYFGGKADDQEKKMKDGSNKARACLEVLAIIESVGSYDSQQNMNLPSCRVQSGHDWDQYKNHPCNWGKKKRGKSRK